MEEADLVLADQRGRISIFVMERPENLLPPGGSDTAREFLPGADGAWFRWLNPADLEEDSLRSYCESAIQHLRTKDRPPVAAGGEAVKAATGAEGEGSTTADTGVPGSGGGPG